MKKFQILAMLMLVLVMGMTSCKYEEGPLISVIPKVERVTNTWIVSSAIVDGTQSSSISWLKEITFFKEGGANAVRTALGVDFAFSGSWTFSEDKSTILLTTQDELTGLTSFDRNFTILKLKEDLLKVTWVEVSTGVDQVYVVEFVPSV